MKICEETVNNVSTWKMWCYLSKGKWCVTFFFRLPFFSSSPKDMFLLILDRGEGDGWTTPCPWRLWSFETLKWAGRESCEITFSQCHWDLGSYLSGWSSSDAPRARSEMESSVKVPFFTHKVPIRRHWHLQGDGRKWCQVDIKQRRPQRSWEDSMIEPRPRWLMCSTHTKQTWTCMNTEDRAVGDTTTKQSQFLKHFRKVHVKHEKWSNEIQLLFYW